VLPAFVLVVLSCCLGVLGGVVTEHCWLYNVMVNSLGVVYWIVFMLVE